MTGWLDIRRGEAPLVIAFPHGGTGLVGLDEQYVSPWLAQLDTDWWIADLYAFAADLGATLVATDISRSVIDMNRDPSGASLYPGQATTELCPTTTFDGEPLYRFGEPDEAEIMQRLNLYHRPYHEALGAELARLRALHGRVVLYDAHSIRSHVPRLFDGELPQFNIGTNGGATCDPALETTIAAICATSGRSHVVNGRFKGGWTTRHYGRPEEGIHAIQMELAQRGYMAEPAELTDANWPSPLDPRPAIRPVLEQVIAATLDFAKGQA
ncbi:N-formylglutamate deformylase [Sphingopyxis macrogoltabida]|uniref:N-formylglutamate deformylase n=1 Tax=Sphingopyxis macrogoltabida TaxID=33050 RepID=A0A0N9V0S9_SPHMC|nr:N-formylglutamate deformylase [Sphingopyxis macrogoltabida]ALH81158.1 N-formylglutamate deformylase [Sphingopyxis macrogoltabida]